MSAAVWRHWPKLSHPAAGQAASRSPPSTQDPEGLGLPLSDPTHAQGSPPLQRALENCCENSTGGAFPRAALGTEASSQLHVGRWTGKESPIGRLGSGGLGVARRAGGGGTGTGRRLSSERASCPHPHVFPEPPKAAYARTALSSRAQFPHRVVPFPRWKECWTQLCLRPRCSLRDLESVGPESSFINWDTAHPARLSWGRVTTWVKS